MLLNNSNNNNIIIILLLVIMMMRINSSDGGVYGDRNSTITKDGTTKTKIIAIPGKFFDDNNDTTPSSAALDDPRYYGESARRDFLVIMGFGLFACQLNFWGALYVIYRTYRKWKAGGSLSITLSLRFPFYIALTDSTLSLSYTTNLLYTTIYKVPWPQPQCSIVGANVIAFFALNNFLITFVAISTWLRVCREVYVETGIYDYRLWITTLSLSVLIDLISIHDFGQQKYWCAASFKSKIIPLTMSGLITLCLITILFCYVKVLLKIKNLDDSLLTASYTPPQRVYIEKRALRKLISYIFTFMLQFIPLIAYHLCSLLKVENVFLYVLATTTVNFGGIGNFTQYLLNEGIFSENTANNSFQRSSSAHEICPKDNKTNRLSSVKKESGEVMIKC